MATATSKRVGVIGGLVAAVAATTTFLVWPESLQSKVNAANCGDVIVLEAGQTHDGNITLPDKQCTEFITIQSSRVSELPEGVRINPATQAPLLARLQSTINAEPVVKTAPGAHHYRFIGIEFTTRDASVFVYDLVRFGEGRESQKTTDAVPHSLVIDRSYIHGWPTQDSQRGVTLNSANTDIINSYISDIHGAGYDTQCIAGWNGTNTVRVINNHLECAGENVMFGGADAALAELMPMNIEIRRNYLFKPLSWKVGHPTYAGKHWTVKNLLELKAAKNVVIDGNVMENNWTDGQAGVAVLFTVRNQDCSNPWATVQNVTFSNNTVRGSDGGALNFLGKDNEAELAYGKCKDAARAGSIRGSGFTASNNLFYDIGGSFITINGFENVSLNRTTNVQRGNFTTVYGQPSPGFKYTNGLMIDHQYGIYIEGGKKVGDPAGLLPDGMIEQNVVIAPYDKSSWPANNQFVPAMDLPSDFRSPFPNAGADIAALQAVQAGAGTSQPLPSPSPSVTATVTVSPSPTPTQQQVSANNTRVPPATELVAADGAVWTLSGNVMLRNGADTGGRGPELLWCAQAVYALGVDGAWWKWIDGTTNWTRVVVDPCGPVASPSPTPTATSTPTPLPSPTSTPTPQPSPQPTATVTPTPLRFCRSGERPGNPPVCRCRNNAPVRPNGKCP